MTGTDENPMSSDMPTTVKDVKGLLAESFTMSRLVTLGAILLVTGIAGQRWFENPVIMWSLSIFVGAPWLIFGSLGRVSEGPGLWHVRLFAGLGFPMLLIVIGTMAAVISDLGETDVFPP